MPEELLGIDDVTEGAILVAHKVDGLWRLRMVAHVEGFERDFIDGIERETHVGDFPDAHHVEAVGARLDETIQQVAAEWHKLREAQPEGRGDHKYAFVGPTPTHWTEWNNCSMTTCRNCGHKYQWIAVLSDAVPDCPECGAKGSWGLG